MKWLFGLVLLLNIVVAGWFGFFSGSREETSAKPQSSTTNGSIVLLSERETAKPPAPEPRAPEPPAQPIGPVECYSLGAFRTNEEATGAVMQLKAQGWLSLARKADERVPKGYWVFIPPSRNTADAKKTLREMHAANVDSFLITKGPNTNAISVGIYSDRKYAEERRDELRAKGFDIKLEERFTTQSQFWVDMMPEGTLRLTDDVRHKIMIDFPGAELRQSACGENSLATP